MKKALLGGLILLSLLVLTSNVSANFACGFINDSEELAASWIDVLIYYDENPSKVATCKTSPENKFCCDLETIDSVTWQPGKTIHAEIFSSELGYVAGPVSLLTTEDGYDLFPDMQLKKVIKFNQPLKTILINKSEVLFNLSIHPNYNNLKYALNNQPDQIICESCTETQFLISDLSKGKNEIILIAYNPETGREISETFYVSSLDYLHVLDSFECPRCKTINDKVYVPSKSEVNLTLTLDASHNISGIVNVYFPVDWEVGNEFLWEDYSPTHDLVKWDIEDSSKPTITYSLVSSGTWFKRKDLFKYEISDFSKERSVFVYSLTRFFPFGRHHKFSEEAYFKKFLFEGISSTEPLILEVDNYDFFEVIAIYPTEETHKAHAYITYKERRFFNRKYISFNLLSNLPNRKIETILFRFKAPKEDSVLFSMGRKSIDLHIYNQDTEYNYYEAYVSTKGQFKIKIY